MWLALIGGVLLAIAFGWEPVVAAGLIALVVAVLYWATS